MTAIQRSGQLFGVDAASTAARAGIHEPAPTASSRDGAGTASSFAGHAAGSKMGSRAGSLRPGASMDLALLNLASSASVDLRFRRAESLLPCGLTNDELFELIGRVSDVEKSSGQAAARAGAGSKQRGSMDGRPNSGGGMKGGASGPAGLAGKDSAFES